MWFKPKRSHEEALQRTVKAMALKLLTTGISAKKVDENLLLFLQDKHRMSPEKAALFLEATKQAHLDAPEHGRSLKDTLEGSF
jgi:phage terminase large subunit GpA-like protein